MSNVIQESNLIEWVVSIAKMNGIIRKETSQTSHSRGLVDHKYLDQESLLVAEGQVFDAVYEPFTDEERDILYHQLKRMRTTWKVGQCFMNAFQLADWPGSKIRYAEGLATNLTIPMNHAWGVLNGKVIDLTWMHKDFYDEGNHEERSLKHNRMRASSKLIARVERLRQDPEIEYMGIYVPTEELYAGMMREKVYYSILQDWESMWPLQKDGVPKEWSQTHG